LTCFIAVTPVTKFVVTKNIGGSGTPRLVKATGSGAGRVGHTLVGERKYARKSNLGTTFGLTC